MAINYKYDLENKLLLTQISGILTSAEVLNYFTELNQDKTAKFATKEIVDLNQIEDFVLTFSDLKFITQQTEILSKNGHEITLICAYNLLSQDIEKMMRPLFLSIDLLVIPCSSEEEFKKNKKNFFSLKA